jgi:hypothetical protein
LAKIALSLLTSPVAAEMIALAACRRAIKRDHLAAHEAEPVVVELLLALQDEDLHRAHLVCRLNGGQPEAASVTCGTFGRSGIFKRRCSNSLNRLESPNTM